MVRCLRTRGGGGGFIGGGGGGAAAGEITSIYATHLGTIALTWSRTSLGLFLLTQLRLTPAESSEAVTDDFRLRLHLLIPWKRKGSKRKDFTTIGGVRRVVELAWDLSLATFSRERGPEPTAGYFVSIAVDGEVALVTGKHEEENGRKGPGAELISQMERVRFGENGGELTYATKARFEGKETVISISIDLQDEEMALEIDGDRVLEVDRLRWKFRGSDWAVMKSGGRVQVSWDLHDWFFRQKGSWMRSAAATGHAGDAVFVFLFEKCEEGEGEIGKGIEDGKHECYLKIGEWNESSSASRSTSTSSEASAEGLEFGEEAEPRSGDDGRFTLLVRGRKP